MPESGRIADMEGIFKSVTSGDEISFERKFVDSRTARVTAPCVFATNELPRFSEAGACGEGMESVMVVNQFRVTNFF